MRLSLPYQRRLAGETVEFHIDGNAAFTVAAALAAGMLGQAVAQHLRLPGIVLLLFIGFLLGPDVANVVQPGVLGDSLNQIVGFAVAVILFEGGMSLNLRRLRREERPIRQLVTVGALVSLATGACLVWLAKGWGWQRSLLFGTLVVVTGPTVVTPLLRRIRVKKTVSTILEAEGVLIDAIGAITAAVALEIVLQPSNGAAVLAGPSVFGRLAFGATCGLIGGGALSLILRYRNIIPEGLENPFTLAWAILVFQVANATIHETGIAAVTVAGFVVGNTRTHVGRELREFKEQLTVMLIGLLFVLLVADVRLAELLSLGWSGLFVAFGCVFLVRPLSVAAGTWGTEMTARERVFAGWIGPRGIVAAAVASLFGYELDRVGLEGGAELRALVFLVIAVTVLWSALTGPLAARLLGLKRGSNDGWAIVGGNALARTVGRLLVDDDQSVVLIDHDASNVRAIEDAELRAIHKNALEKPAMELAQLDTRVGAMAITGNEEVNYLVAQRGRHRSTELRFPVAITSWTRGITPAMVEELGGEILFGARAEVDAWAEKIERGYASVSWFELRGRTNGTVLTGATTRPGYLPLVHRRGNDASPVTSATSFRDGSQVAFLIDEQHSDAVTKSLRQLGWTPLLSIREP